MSIPRVLIADDEPALRTLFRRWLRAEPWHVETAGNGREALSLLCERRFDIAVLDLSMPHFSGIELLKILRRKRIRTEVILLTGFGTIEIAVEAMKIGATDFLQKPIISYALIAAIRRLIEARTPSTHILAERIDRELSRQLPSPALQLGGLARQFGLSPGYVSHLLREHFGVSFQERLTHHRIERAKSLILTTDEPLKTIALHCGFKHQTRLTEAFSRIVGMNPRKFREIAVDRRKNIR